MQKTKYIIFILFLTLLASCEPTTVLDVKNEAEANLGVFSYPTTQVNFRVGDPVQPVSPTMTDSGVFLFSVDPELPAGIAVDPNSGEFFGVALEVTPKRTYTFKANLDGVGVEYRYDIDIEVTHIPPSNLVYTPSSLNLTFTNSFIPITPIVSGVVDRFLIEPALPNGLIFSSATGQISGVPLIEDYEATHFVKAINQGGEATVAISIKIVPQPPTSIAYGNTGYTCEAGNSCFISAPIVSPLTAVDLTYAIAPALPQGYSFNTSTGEISLGFGARRASSPMTNYSVSVFNDGGVTSTNISLETVVSPILSLGYLTTVNLNKDIHFPISLSSNVSPFFTPITQFEIASNNLPDGLTLNNQTGVITGVASQMPGTYPVTVRAIYELGLFDQVINFTINEVPITNLAHTSPPTSFILGDTITAPTDPTTGNLVVPYTYDGSLATFFSFEHFDESMNNLGTQLPSGLTWNSATGSIVGTPAELINGHMLRVRAHNGQGASAPLDLNFDISEPAPGAISYNNTPFNNNFSATSCSDFNISPTLLSGGSPLEYTITPPLGSAGNFPSVGATSEGLSFDETTGQIAGNISEHYTTPKIYVITASNPAGSASVQITINTTADIPAFSIPDFSASRGIAQSITPIMNSCAIGTSQSISPVEPSEFSLDTLNQISYSGQTTGQTELPSLVANKTYNYTISNSAGSQSQELDIELKYRLAGSNNFATPIVTDFDSDGSNDIIMIHSFCYADPTQECLNSRFSFLRAMNSNGEYSEVFSQAIPRGTVRYPAVFDTDQDNLKDLVYLDPFANAPNGQIVIQRQQTSPNELGPVIQTIDLNFIPQSVHYADLNLDSTPDIFVTGENSIEIYHSNSTTNLYSLEETISLINFANGLGEIALTQLNADNIIDIVILKKDDNTLCPLIATNSMEYPDTCTQFLALPLENSREIYAGDLSGNPKLDLVVISGDGQTQLTTIKNNGDSLATFTPIIQQVSTYNAEPRSLVFTNITGSIQKDMVFYGEGFLSVLDGEALNNSSLTTQSSAIDGIHQISGGLLYNGLDALLSCSTTLGIGNCAIDYSADKRL